MQTAPVEKPHIGEVSAKDERGQAVGHSLKRAPDEYGRRNAQQHDQAAHDKPQHALLSVQPPGQLAGVAERESAQSDADHNHAEVHDYDASGATDYIG